MRHLFATLALICLYHECFADEHVGFVGVSVASSDYTRVTRVASGSPAAAAGVLAGDRLLRVGGDELAALKTPEEFRRATSGPIGELVIVVMRRARDGSEIIFKLERTAPRKPKRQRVSPEGDKRAVAARAPRPNYALQRTAGRFDV